MNYPQVIIFLRPMVHTSGLHTKVTDISTVIL